MYLKKYMDDYYWNDMKHQVKYHVKIYKVGQMT